MCPICSKLKLQLDMSVLHLSIPVSGKKGQSICQIHCCAHWKRMANRSIPLPWGANQMLWHVRPVMWISSFAAFIPCTKMIKLMNALTAFWAVLDFLAFGDANLMLFGVKTTVLLLDVYLQLTMMPHILHLFISQNQFPSIIWSILGQFFCLIQFYKAKEVIFLAKSLVWPTNNIIMVSLLHQAFKK